MVIKRTRRSTTEKVGGEVGQCGRWVLRQTKIRQARVTEQLSKDLAKRRKRHQPPSEVLKEESCVGENSVAVKAVYVKNLPKNITQDRLKELFEHHGKITKVVLPSAKVGHEKSRFGFVHFKERSSAMKALKNTEKYEIDGQVLECSLAKPPADQKSQQPALFPTYPPADQKSQQPALLPTYPPPWLGYGLVGGAYGALGAGYGGAGFGQAVTAMSPPLSLPQIRHKCPSLFPPSLPHSEIWPFINYDSCRNWLIQTSTPIGKSPPMMYGPSPIIYGSTPGMTLMPILLPDGRIGYVLQQPGAQGPAPPPPQQSSSTGGSSSGGSSSSDSGRGDSCYNPY